MQLRFCLLRSLRPHWTEEPETWSDIDTVQIQSNGGATLGRNTGATDCIGAVASRPGRERPLVSSRRRSWPGDASVPTRRCGCETGGHRPGDARLCGQSQGGHGSASAQVGFAGSSWSAAKSPVKPMTSLAGAGGRGMYREGMYHEVRAGGTRVACQRGGLRPLCSPRGSRRIGGFLSDGASRSPG